MQVSTTLEGRRQEHHDMRSRSTSPISISVNNSKRIQANGVPSVQDVTTTTNGKLPRRRRSSIADALEPPDRESYAIQNAEELASISVASLEVESVHANGEPIRGPKVYSQFSVAVLAGLMAPSVFGGLARLGILALTSYDGHAIFPLAWVQSIGCLIMGFALGWKEPINTYYGPLYTAITTGFCGSLTTFSSWQMDVFLSWANSSGAHRDWLRDVIDGLGKTIFTLAVSLSSVRLGVHLANVHIPSPPHPPGPFARYTFSIISSLVYFATIPAYFLLSASFRHQATAALLFSFPATLLRYALAVTLTPRFKLFPLGTFVANIVGTGLLGVFHVLQRISPLPSTNSCAILQGLIDGFCGGLTTISTFAVEVSVLERNRAWLYVALSWATSQLLLLVIVGPAWLSGNIKESNTCTFK